jgi:hypothetical protein
MPFYIQRSPPATCNAAALRTCRVAAISVTGEWRNLESFIAIANDQL